MDMFVLSIVTPQAAFPSKVVGLCWSMQDAMDRVDDLEYLLPDNLPEPANPNESYEIRWREKPQVEGEEGEIELEDEDDPVGDVVLGEEVIIPAYVRVETIDMTDQVAEMPEEVVEEINQIQMAENDIDALLIGDHRMPEDIAEEVKSPLHPMKLNAGISKELRQQVQARDAIEDIREEEINPIGIALEKAIEEIVLRRGSFHTLAAVYVCMFRLEVSKRDMLKEARKDTPADGNAGKAIASMLASIQEVVSEDVDDYEENAAGD